MAHVRYIDEPNVGIFFLRSVGWFLRQVYDKLIITAYWNENISCKIQIGLQRVLFVTFRTFLFYWFHQQKAIDN